MSDVFKDNHIAPTLYDNKGRPYCEAPFTPKSDTKRYVCIVPPEKVIPVIFVPGIMGSNLALNAPIEYASLKDYGRIAWAPDDTSYMVKKFRALDAAQRRRVLDPRNTVVAGFSDIGASGMAPFKDAEQGVQENWKAEFKRRGWDTIMLSSYGPMLCELEYHLNRMYYHGELSQHWKSRILNPHRDSPRHPHPWGKITGDSTLSETQLKKASGYWYPVYAVGYNWLQSNEIAGKYLARQIADTIKKYVEFKNEVQL